MSTRTFVVPAVALLIVGTACSGGTPVVEGTSPPGTASVSPPVSSSPPASPDGGGTFQAAFASGTAHVEVSGSASGTFDLALVPEGTGWSPPPGPMNLQWADQAAEELSISGTSSTGTFKTATSPPGSEMSLTLTVVAEGKPAGFTSQFGECTITIARSEPSGVEGSFRCPHMTPLLGTGTYKISGTFSAGP